MSELKIRVFFKVSLKGWLEAKIGIRKAEIRMKVKIVVANEIMTLKHKVKELTFTAKVTVTDSLYS